MMSSARDGGIVRITLPARSRTWTITRPDVASLWECSSRLLDPHSAARGAAAPMASRPATGGDSGTTDAALAGAGDGHAVLRRARSSEKPGVTASTRRAGFPRPMGGRGPISKLILLSVVGRPAAALRRWTFIRRRRKELNPTPAAA